MNKEKLAEFIGIMLGDGNLYQNKEKGHYMIRITGHLIDDKEHHELHVRSLFLDLFKKEMRVKCYKDRRVLYYYGKEIFNQLLDFGLISGNKLKNNIKIPEWIFANKGYIKACIRVHCCVVGTCSKLL